jgi:di/tricarboxylate transporter
MTGRISDITKALSLLCMASTYAIVGSIRKCSIGVMHQSSAWVSEHAHLHATIITFTALLLLSQFTIVGTSLMAMYPLRPYRWKNGPKLWKFDRLLICLVSKGHNLQVCSSLVCFYRKDYILTM